MTKLVELTGNTLFPHIAGVWSWTYNQSGLQELAEAERVMAYMQQQGVAPHARMLDLDGGHYLVVSDHRIVSQDPWDIISGSIDEDLEQDSDEFLEASDLGFDVLFNGKRLEVLSDWEFRRADYVTGEIGSALVEYVRQNIWSAFEGYEQDEPSSPEEAVKALEHAIEQAEHTQKLSASKLATVQAGIDLDRICTPSWRRLQEMVAEVPADARYIGTSWQLIMRLAADAEIELSPLALSDGELAWGEIWIQGRRVRLADFAFENTEPDDESDVLGWAIGEESFSARYFPLELDGSKHAAYQRFREDGLPILEATTAARSLG